MYSSSVMLFSMFYDMFVGDVVGIKMSLRDFKTMERSIFLFLREREKIKENKSFKKELLFAGTVAERTFRAELSDQIESEKRKQQTNNQILPRRASPDGSG